MSKKNISKSPEVKNVEVNEVQTEKDTAKKAGVSFRVYSDILILVILFAFIAFNALMTLVDSRFDASLDLTAFKIYTLSDETKNVLADLDQDVEIYTLYPGTYDDEEVSLLLKRYAAANSHIKVSNVDPEQNPAFTNQFSAAGESIANYSVIVTNAAHDKYKVYALDELKIFVNTSDGSTVKIGSKVEQKVTSAIYYIMSGTINRAVFIQGHNETNPNSLAQLLTILDGLNFELVTSNYLSNHQDLDPATDTVFVIGPQSDLSDEEYDELKTFLDGGGRAMFFMANVIVDEASQTATTKSERLSNFDLLLKAYDVEVNKDYIFAADTDVMYQTANNLVCTTKSHTITDTIIASGRSVVISNASSIKMNTVSSKDITTTELVSSADKTYAKSLLESLSNLSYEQGDAIGPFAIGVLSENASNGSQIMVFGSSSFLTDTEIQRSGNVDLVLNSVSYLNERTSSIVVAQKQTYGNVMQFTSNGQVYSSIIIVVAVVPIVLIAIGWVVWKRRKKR